MKDIRAELEKILDDNISYGYEFQMSDYAVSNKEDDEYYQRGREEVKEATDQILALIEGEVMRQLSIFKEVYASELDDISDRMHEEAREALK